MNQVQTAASQFLKRYEAQKARRTPVEEWWQTIADYVIPRKSYISEAQEVADPTKFRRLYDTTAVDAAETLANGHMSYITPSDQRWFSWEAPEWIKSDEIDGWYRTCSLIAAKELAASNFYTLLHETYQDRAAFGIGCLAAWPGRKNVYNFRCHEIQSYVIAEDDEGYVTTLYSEFEWPISKIVQQFGEDSLNDKLKESWEKFKEDGTDKQHTFIHGVEPNYDAQPGLPGIKNMAYSSKYCAKEGPHFLYEGGLHEFPYTCSRYLTHNASTGLYGYSPSWRAMPAISQLNINEKIMDLLAEKKAIPPVLIPDYLQGDVDMRAGGITTFMTNRTKGPFALPQEWATAGDYQIGHERSESKRRDIKEAFHVDLFRLFAELEKRSQMSVLEVTERQSEKLVAFSPTFTRFTSDFQTCMERIFRIGIRAGRFPPPPPGALMQDPMTGRIDVENPKVLYQSKVALALQSLQNTGIDRTLARAGEFAAVDPTAIDEIHPGRTIHLLGRNEGVPEEIFRTEEEKAELQQKREAQEAALLAAELSKAAPNQAPPEA